MSDRQKAPSLAASFRHAFAGLVYVIHTQRNARIHAVVTILVLGVGFWLRIARRDWVILLLTIACVWLAECFNTALEAVVDLASPEYHSLARLGKDAAAAAVLISAIVSVIIGLLILGPPLLSRIAGGSS